jgi:hypothetical protein
MKRAATLVMVMTFALAAGTPAFAKKSAYQQQLQMMQQMQMQQQLQQQQAQAAGAASADPAEAARQAFVQNWQAQANAQQQWAQKRANAQAAYNNAAQHGFRGFSWNSWKGVNGESARVKRIGYLKAQLKNTWDPNQRKMIMQQIAFLEHHRF